MHCRRREARLVREHLICKLLHARSQVRTIEPVGIGEVWKLVVQLCRMHRSHFNAGIMRQRRWGGVRKRKLVYFDMSRRQFCRLQINTVVQTVVGSGVQHDTSQSRRGGGEVTERTCRGQLRPDDFKQQLSTVTPKRAVF
jgi:hypothetical protein